MKTKHGHLLFLILALLATIFVAAIYFYMNNMINVYMAKTATLKATIAAGAVNKERDQSFMKAYEATANKWAKLPNLFVQSNRIVDFIESVEALGKESGGKVSLSSLDADNLDLSPPGTGGTVRVHITAQGSWQSVMHALALAETLPYKVSINNFHADVSSDSQNQVAVEKNSNNAAGKDAPRQNWNLSFDLKAQMIAVVSATSTIQ